MATLPAQDLSVDLRAVTVRPTWGAQEHRRWDRLVAEHHYLPFHGVIGKGLRHVAVHGETWLALIGWQPGAFKLAARDRWIGWPAEQQFRRLHLIANNSRFVILTPGRVRNLASRVLGLSLRRLSQDIQAVHGYPVFLAETFVDVSRFVGTCYRASNWRSLGLTRGFAREPGGSARWRHHGQPKEIFVFELTDAAAEALSRRRLSAGIERASDVSGPGSRDGGSRDDRPCRANAPVAIRGLEADRRRAPDIRRWNTTPAWSSGRWRSTARATKSRPYASSPAASTSQAGCLGRIRCGALPESTVSSGCSASRSPRRPCPSTCRAIQSHLRRHGGRSSRTTSGACQKTPLGGVRRRPTSSSYPPRRSVFYSCSLCCGTSVGGLFTSAPRHTRLRRGSRNRSGRPFRGRQHHGI